MRADSLSSEFEAVYVANVVLKSHHLADDASNKPLFDLSDDDDRVFDIVLSPSKHDNRLATSETRFSPALSISTHTADALGEDDDDDVIIVNHIHASSFLTDPQDKLLNEPSFDSLFTPPPSEPSSSESPPPLDHGKSSRTRKFSPPAPSRTKTVLSHILVPPLSNPKSAYVKLSTLVKPRKRPHRTAQDRLRDVLDAAWKNNESLAWSGEDDGQGEPRRKKRKRKLQDQGAKSHPVLKPSQSFEGPVAFVKRRVEKEPVRTEPVVIDLTLDDDDQKPPPPDTTHSVPQPIEVPSPSRQPSDEETRIGIGVIHSVSYRTLLLNTRFLRGKVGDPDPRNNVSDSPLPFRKRRALLDNNNSDGSRTLDDEFSLGHPVVSRVGQNMTDDDDSDDETIESEDPPPLVPCSPRPRSPSMAPPPKIDLAAEFRKKKATAARRSSSALTPSKKKAPALVPSAKSLGKRKAVDSASQHTQPQLPLSNPFVTNPGAETNFDSFINYWPPSPVRSTTLTSYNFPYLDTGTPYGYPDPYLAPSSTVPNVNSVDHRHHQSSPPFSSIEPTPSSLDNYTGALTDFDHFTTIAPPPSGTNYFPTWPPEPQTCLPYVDSTVDPSLLAGETLGTSEYPVLFPEFGNQSLETADVEVGTSPSLSRSASPRTLSSTSPSVHSRKVGDSQTIYVRHRPTTLSDSPKRRFIKRSMPDMVPFSELDLSSSSSGSESDDDDESTSSVARSSVVSKQSRRIAPPLPAGPKVMVGGRLWPMQDEATYCHQCRNKTTVLKLMCKSCPKIYCVRCLTERYPDEPKALQMKKSGCPSCLDYCNCTSCCKKRGVEYISTKDALAGGVASRAQLAAPSTSKRRRSSAFSSSFSSQTPDIRRPRPLRSPSPLPSSRFVVPAGSVYWGTVYAADGSKIGASYTCLKGDVVRASSPSVSTKAVSETRTMTTTTDGPPRKKKRVYVGKEHPTWRFDNAVKISVLDPVPAPRKVHEWSRPRKYVGNKALLFYKTEEMARELADLSPLSSLEDDDWKGDIVSVKEEEEEEDDRVVQKAGDESRRGSTGESLTDRDVMRAIGLGLYACGIGFAG